MLRDWKPSALFQKKKKMLYVRMRVNYVNFILAACEIKFIPSGACQSILNCSEIISNNLKWSKLSSEPMLICINRDVMVYAWACVFFFFFYEKWEHWLNLPIAIIRNMKEKIILFLTCADVSDKTDTIVLL